MASARDPAAASDAERSSAEQLLRRIRRRNEAAFDHCAHVVRLLHQAAVHLRRSGQQHCQRTLRLLAFYMAEQLWAQGSARLAVQLLLALVAGDGAALGAAMEAAIAAQVAPTSGTVAAGGGSSGVARVTLQRSYMAPTLRPEDEAWASPLRFAASDCVPAPRGPQAAGQEGETGWGSELMHWPALRLRVAARMRQCAHALRLSKVRRWPPACLLLMPLLSLPARPRLPPAPLTAHAAGA